MNILVTNNHVIYNSHNPDIDHKKEPAKNPGDSDFFYRLCPVLSDDFCICVHVHNALCRASPISTRKQLMKTRAPRLSVNALYRASPISTVPFKKPYKINGFRDRFQGVIVRKF